MWAACHGGAVGSGVDGRRKIHGDDDIVIGAGAARLELDADRGHLDFILRYSSQTIRKAAVDYSSTGSPRSSYVLMKGWEVTFLAMPYRNIDLAP